MTSSSGHNPQETQGWTAAQYVAAAWKGARDTRRLYKPLSIGTTLLVWPDGDALVTGTPAIYRGGTVFRITLTPESIASEYTLARALLANAIVTFEPHDPSDVYSVGIVSGGPIGRANTAQSARDALLDALLGSPEGR